MKYCCPFIAGQSEDIKSYFHVTLMMLYRIILKSNTYMTRCEDICSTISLPMPREVLAQNTVIFMHKIHFTKSPPQLYSMYRYPVRSWLSTRPTPRSVPNTERSKRGMMYAGVKLLQRIPECMFSLEPAFFRKSVKSMREGILSSDEQRNW